MVRTIPAKSITLNNLKTGFNLEFVENDRFFREWQDNLPELSETEKQRLDRVKASYSHLIEYPPLLEDSVKMVVVSPLLDLVGFYLPPFHIATESSVEIALEDEDVIYKGRLDVLGLFEQLELMIIESKQFAFSLESGRAQLLAYMLAKAKPNIPIFGLLTNGSSFRFIKLIKQETPKYAVSIMFDLFNPGNDLYSVLSIIKSLGELAIATS